MKRNCIVVPLYKSFSNLNYNEQQAIYQMSRVLKDWDIYAVSPERYEDYPSNFNTWILFDRSYFTYSGYNEMCKSDFFYQTFINLGYTYMTLIQADVWIFQDNLDYFLNIFDRDNLDYIGAPWAGVWFAPDGTVGNGGFCIRRLETFRNICRDYPGGGGNEDVYFLQNHKDKLNLAPARLAAEFSWEEKPYFWYKLMDFKLPMGCHAYASTPDRISFWRQYISDIKEIKAIGGLMDIYNNPEFEKKFRSE